MKNDDRIYTPPPPSFLLISLTYVFQSIKQIIIGKDNLSKYKK